MSHNPSNPTQAAALAAHYKDQPMTKANWRDWDASVWSILLDTDSYKVSMWKQYPPETCYVTSYIEARGGRFPNTTFFGLQAFLKKLERALTATEVEFANAVWTAHGEPFPYELAMKIVTEHGGKLPVKIEAVEEGTVVPVHNALVRITNTHPDFWWLPTWIETAMLRAVWFPTTVATLSWSIKQIITQYLKETTDDEVIPLVLPFRLHDFGSRGTSSYESAMLGGMGHMVNFMGTDTGAALIGAYQFYGAEIDPDKEAIPGTGIMTAPAYSIPAAEHSTITSWGREGEVDAYRNMLKQFAAPGSIVAVVSDSYDFFNALEIWGGELKDTVESSGGTLVVRPDSGDPTVIPVQAIERLGELFGYSVNTKGYKVLPDCVKVIQGDGIDLDNIATILERLKDNGWSAENIAFGMGGALLQQPNRDTQKWAMKCSAVQIGDEWKDVFKDPITDPGKKSKKGRLGLVLEGGVGSLTYRTKRIEHIHPGNDLLTSVYENGKMTKFQTFDEIRERSNRWNNAITEVMAKAA